MTKESSGHILSGQVGARGRQMLFRHHASPDPDPTPQQVVPPPEKEVERRFARNLCLTADTHGQVFPNLEVLCWMRFLNHHVSQTSLKASGRSEVQQRIEVLLPGACPAAPARKGITNLMGIPTCSQRTESGQWKLVFRKGWGSGLGRWKLLKKKIH